MCFCAVLLIMLNFVIIAERVVFFFPTTESFIGILIGFKRRKFLVRILILLGIHLAWPYLPISKFHLLLSVSHSLVPFR